MDFGIYGGILGTIQITDKAIISILIVSRHRPHHF